MKIILTQNVPNLGQAGEVKNVSVGYARNFLLKNHLAELATPANLKKLAVRQAKLAKATEIQTAQQQKLCQQLNSLKLTISQPANKQGKLFASIDTKQIATAIKNKLGLDINPAWLKLPEPIKHLGSYQVAFQLADQFKGKLDLEVRSL